MLRLIGNKDSSFTESRTSGSCSTSVVACRQINILMAIVVAQSPDAKDKVAAVMFEVCCSVSCEDGLSTVRFADEV